MKTTFDFLSLISSYSLPEFTPSEKGAMRGGGGGAGGGAKSLNIEMTGRYRSLKGRREPEICTGD